MWGANFAMIEVVSRDRTIAEKKAAAGHRGNDVTQKMRCVPVLDSLGLLNDRARSC
jgi:hypothetical protein